MTWDVEGYGNVEADNACRTFLEKLERTDGFNWRDINKEDLQVGQHAHAIFKSGMGRTEAKVVRLT